MTAERSGSAEMNRVVRLLLEQPHRFQLFQAIRILEQEAAKEAIALGRPVPPEIGGLDRGAAVRSPVRFHATATLSYPTAVIARAWSEPPEDSVVERQEPGHVTDLEVSCFGLVGPAGTLPAHYTSMVVDRLRSFRDDTLKSFLDLFVTRLMALNYRAWSKYRQAIRYEQTAVAGRNTSWEVSTEPKDAVTTVVSALVGLAGQGLSSRMAVDDHAVFHYSSQFARGVRPAEALERLLADQLQVGVRVEQFVGRWLELESADQTALASESQPEGLHAQLGMGALLGKRVWDIESTFEVVLGPLRLGQLRAFLPGGHALKTLTDFLRFYAGPSYEIVLRLVLDAADVPPCRLGGDVERQQTRSLQGDPLLGWTTWLVGKDGAREDRADTAFVL